MKQPIFCSGVRVNEISLRYSHPKKRILPKIRDTADAGELFKQCFDPERIALKEFFFALYLNSAHEVLAVTLLSVGSENGTVVSVKELVSNAILLNARSVMVSHNHPSGRLKPSHRDKRLTEQIGSALELFNMILLDHIIVSKKGYVSLFDTHPELFPQHYY